MYNANNTTTQTFVIFLLLFILNLIKFSDENIGIGGSRSSSPFGQSGYSGSTPRVPFNRAPLYKHGAEFMCLDGSKTILYKQVNDDYCDCADGSDEPGTSACPNGKFYCANKGHSSEYIPTSRVNDKICDCCDGSDEYSGSTDCPNICDELGKGAREERQRKASIAKKGFAVRQTLAQEGQKIKAEKVDAAIPLRAERDELQPQKDALAAAKKQAEDREKALTDAHRDKWLAAKLEKKKLRAADTFKQIDTDGDQKITVAEMQKLEYLDNDHDSAVSEAEAKLHLSVDEADFDHFVNNMFDALKTAKKHYEQDKRDKEQIEEHDDLVADEDKIDAHHDEEEEEADDHAAGEESDSDDDVMPPHDEETKQAVEAADAARRDFSDIEMKISGIDGKIREAESFSEQDFGEDLAWAPLKGQCFELTEMQYIYRMCPFDRTVQKDKNGHGETSLGSWKEWSGAVPRKYSSQKYDDGQQCWNGPRRSTNVIIECGEENVLVSASEPAKCEYEFLFRTPAACNDPEKEEPQHTEL